ncbi:MAG TPA: hypothetical protein VFY92_06650 [Hyphomicrobiaceae bacterium]|nr:hypothetical protein [Hyphomicrobiaceae bacterium]
MVFRSQLSPEQWAEARRQYADGVRTEDIAKGIGLSRSAVAAHARREGWLRMGAATGKARKPRRGGSRAAVLTAAARGRLAVRLYRIIEFSIRMMELRMTRQLQTHERDLERDPDGGGPPALTKDERDSFVALIQSINKITEMVSEPAPSADPAAIRAGVHAGKRKSAAGPVNPELAALSDDIDADGLAAASEKDSYRREIAEHLAKMFPKP